MSHNLKRLLLPRVEIKVNFQKQVLICSKNLNFQTDLDLKVSELKPCELKGDASNLLSKIDAIISVILF